VVHAELYNKDQQDQNCAGKGQQQITDVLRKVSLSQESATTINCSLLAIGMEAEESPLLDTATK
jgi:hypothetical protein